MSQPIGKKEFIINEDVIKPFDIISFSNKLNEVIYAEDFYKLYSRYNVLNVRLEKMILLLGNINEQNDIDTYNDVDAKLLIFDIDDKHEIIQDFGFDIEGDFKEVILEYYEQYAIMSYIHNIQRLIETVKLVKRLIIKKIKEELACCDGDPMRLRTRYDDNRENVYSLLLPFLEDEGI